MIVLITLLGIILARGFDFISSRHFVVALIVWAVVVVVLQVWEECRLRATVPPEQRFCCLHCATQKPMDQLSAAIKRVCLECADLYEVLQDEV